MTEAYLGVALRGKKILQGEIMDMKTGYYDLEMNRTRGKNNKVSEQVFAY